MNISTLKTALATIIQSATSLTTIPANQNNPRPAVPYILVNFVNVIFVHHDQRTASGNGVITIKGDRELPVSIQAFGETAMQALSDLAMQFQRETVLQSFTTAGLALVEVGQVNDITHLFENKFELRAQMDITLRTHDTLTDDTGTFIEVISGEGNISGREIEFNTEE